MRTLILAAILSLGLPTALQAQLIVPAAPSPIMLPAPAPVVVTYPVSVHYGWRVGFFGRRLVPTRRVVIGAPIAVSQPTVVYQVFPAPPPIIVDQPAKTE